MKRILLSRALLILLALAAWGCKPGGSNPSGTPATASGSSSGAQSVRSLDRQELLALFTEPDRIAENLTTVLKGWGLPDPTVTVDGENVHLVYTQPPAYLPSEYRELYLLLFRAAERAAPFSKEISLTVVIDDGPFLSLGASTSDVASLRRGSLTTNDFLSRLRISEPSEEIGGAASSSPQVSLEIPSIFTYTTINDDPYAVGWVRNSGEVPVMYVEIEVDFFDAAGSPVASTMAYPLVQILPPGAEAPFVIYPGSGLEVASATARISNYSAEVDRETVSVAVRGVVTTIDDYGYVVTGELLNDTKQPVDVSSVVAAVSDSSGALLAVSDGATGVHYLAPGEYGPFAARMAGPAEGREADARVTLFANASPADPLQPPPIALSSSNRTFIDTGETFHVVGEFLNQSDSPWFIQGLLATVYDSDGQVIDASLFDLPAYLGAVAPGESLPFDFNSWSRLFDTESAPAPADYSVQVEWSGHHAASDFPRSLTVAPGEVQFLKGRALFEGAAVNDSGVDLDEVLVLIGLREVSSGQVMGLGTEGSSNLRAGESRDYLINVEFDAGLDPAKLEPFFIAKGILR